jgi:hypothetical protein
MCIDPVASVANSVRGSFFSESAGGFRREKKAQTRTLKTGERRRHSLAGIKSEEDAELE